eukprot:m.207293 g.207293  ORF g.207293 m.207293 type:complete len:141 (+) comp25390_c0_seq2:286-708(+)
MAAPRSLAALPSTQCGNFSQIGVERRTGFRARHTQLREDEKPGVLVPNEEKNVLMRFFYKDKDRIYSSGDAEEEMRLDIEDGGSGSPADMAVEEQSTIRGEGDGGGGVPAADADAAGRHKRSGDPLGGSQPKKWSGGGAS